jgi:hypothetical protein
MGMGASKSHSGTPVGPRRERNLSASFLEMSRKSFLPVLRAGTSASSHLKPIRLTTLGVPVDAPSLAPRPTAVIGISLRSLYIPKG